MNIEKVFIVIAFCIGMITGCFFQTLALSKRETADLAAMQQYMFQTSLEDNYGTMIIRARGNTEEDALKDLADKLDASKSLRWQTVGKPVKGESKYGQVTFEQVVERAPN